MPRMVHGLADMIRSHKISSPTDERMLSKSAPNACNICHLDRSITWTLANLESWTKQEFNTNEAWLRAYGGHLNHPVGKVWLNHPSAIIRQVAVDAYSRSDLGKAEAEDLIRILEDEVPSNRMFGINAMERILGRSIRPEDYSPFASAKERKAQIRALIH